MNRFLLSVVGTILFFSSTANHFTGAYMRYEHIGGSVYRVNLYLYKTCESGAIDLPSFTKIKLTSATNNTEVLKNIPISKIDTVDKFCPGTTNSCDNISATYPGYIIGLYSDTIAVPSSANDWLFVLANSNRFPGISNISSSSSQSFYIESSLDNTTASNSSAIFPVEPPNVIFVNDSIKVPLNGYDPDGDRVEYDFMNPVYDHQKNINYYPGYSFSQPFGSGGLCYIDTSDNMVLKSTTTGKYTIAIRVREYRGTKLMCESILDFVVICINASGGNALSIPYPATIDNKVTSTCPGKSNTLNFNFIDPVSTDKVKLDIEAPTISGWNFSTTPGNGTGAAQGSITWKTPTSFIPSTLPVFYIKAHVEDDACKQVGKATYIYKVVTESCLADSVWPGDANSDNVVNMYDPLAVAMNYGDTGVTRINASNNWTGQSCDFWDGSFLNNIDKKHSDCNGDGKVDTADLQVININYTKTHAKGSRNKTTGVYNLEFDHTGITPNPDSTVSIKMLINVLVPKLYGIAANITVTGLNLSNAPTITYPNTWLGTTINTLSFTKEINANSIDWAYAKTDQQNQAGSGQLATLNFKIPSTAQDGQMVILNYNNAKLIDKDGNEYKDIDLIPDTFYINKPTGIAHTLKSNKQVLIYPNPGKDRLSINIHTTDKEQIQIRIKDLYGRLILKPETVSNISQQKIDINTQGLPKGVYIIEVMSETIRENYKWLKL